MQGIVQVVVLLCLILSAIIDIQKNEIPVFVWTFITAGLVVFLVCQGESGSISFFMGGLCAVLFLMEAIFFNGGGGDVIMMGCIGLLIGVDTLYIIAIAMVLVLIFYAVYYLKEKKLCNVAFPLAPFICAGSIVFYTLKGIIG